MAFLFTRSYYKLLGLMFAGKLITSTQKGKHYSSYFQLWYNSLWPEALSESSAGRSLHPMTYWIYCKGKKCRCVLKAKFSGAFVA